jgi:hypothetical protein
MSLDYDFHVATTLSPQQVLRVALLELGMAPNTERTEEGIFKETMGPGFLVSAGPTGRQSRVLFEETLSIAPDVDLRFWIDSLGDRYAAQTLLLRSVLAVIGQTSGDAVLTFIGETVLLLRREGRLYLDPATGVWTPDRLELVKWPYELKSFSVL